FQPEVSYLLNEISGTFTPFINGSFGVPQFDPPSIYGNNFMPQSYSPNRYYFSANASLARCRHMQIKVDFGGSSVPTPINIEAVQLDSNVLTLYLQSVSGLQVGQTLSLIGLTGATFLNGETITIDTIDESTNSITAAF